MWNVLTSFPTFNTERMSLEKRFVFHSLLLFPWCVCVLNFLSLLIVQQHRWQLHFDCPFKQAERVKRSTERRRNPTVSFVGRERKCLEKGCVCL
jgi:hypothetical protein